VSERSFGTVIRDIGGNVDRIVRAEMRMAVAEFRDGLQAAGDASRLLVAGVALATLAAGFALLSGMLVLTRLVPMWAAALVVASVTGVAAAFLLFAGHSRIASRLAPKLQETASPPESVT
jgi:hypothetical protein